MRCPNCGNENPADYVFCDECGARLQPLGDAGQGDSAPGSLAGMSAADAGPGGSAGMGDPTGAAGGEDPSSWQPAGDVGMGATSTGGSADSAGAGGGWQPQDQDASGTDSGMGGDDMSEAQGEGAIPQPGWSYSGPMGASSSTGMDGGGAGDMDESVPATEDTVGAGAGASASDLPEDMSGTSMPGVVPIAGAYSDTAASPASASGGGDWASAAMRYLEEAQRSLDNLRRHLSGASDYSSAGATGAGMGATAGTDAGQASTYGAMTDTGARSMETGRVSYDPDEVDEAAGAGMTGMAGAGMGTGYSTGDVGSIDTMGEAGGIGYGASPPPDLTGMPGAGAESMGTPTLEPAAEAGTLPGNAMDMDASTGMGAAADTGAGMAGVQPSPAVSAEPVMARLVVIATGAEMPLPDQEEITVGREDPSSGIFPDVDLTPYGGEDGGVSRRHAKLLRIGDDFYVEDLQSTNYTKLDGQRLPAHVRERLEDGARLDFGRVATIFRRS